VTLNYRKKLQAQGTRKYLDVSKVKEWWWMFTEILGNRPCIMARHRSNAEEEEPSNTKNAHDQSRNCQDTKVNTGYYLDDTEGAVRVTGLVRKLIHPFLSIYPVEIK
jgi:hypothetical protein